MRLNSEQDIRTHSHLAGDKLLSAKVSTLERTDLAAAGLIIDCGFEIDLTILQELSLNQTLDTPLSLKIVRKQSKQQSDNKPGLSTSKQTRMSWECLLR